MICLKKIDHLRMGFTLILFFILLSALTDGQCEMTLENNLTLRLEVVNTDLLKGGVLDLSVVIRNNSSIPFVFSTTDKNKPFTESLLDASGYDVLQNKYIVQRKDRSTPEIKIEISPGEEVKYSSKIELEEAFAEKPDVEVGAYYLFVTFPIVRYMDGQYQVNLLESDRVKINIKEQIE